MHKIALLFALAALALALAPTFAADALSYAGPLRSGATYWQGAYAGANLGYQLGWVSNGATRPSGVAAGVHAGYNWQRDQLVFGAEADVQLSDADGVFAPWKFSNPWFGTLRGRAGFATGNLLLYGTLGVALGTLRVQSALTGAAESRTSLGWTGGLGVEIGFAGNWSAKAEYLYIDLGDRSYSLTGLSHGIDSSLLRMGVNYRF
jgi:outer membrane immunogenic protein